MKNKITDFLLSFIIAFTLLTRIPFPFIKKLNFTEKRLAFSLSFFPIVGLFFGILLYFSAKLLIFINLQTEFTAIIILALPYIINKFFHFDGLMDVFDAFLTDKSKEERLKILKDSNTGSFALGGAVIFILLKYIILKSFLKEESLINFLILIPVFSRFSMVLMAFKSAYPRESGTGFNIIGKISILVFITSLSFLILIIICFVLIFGYSIIFILYLTAIFIIMIIFVLLLKLYSYRKIGGITGDVLGTVNELIEALLIIIALISFYMKQNFY